MKLNRLLPNELVEQVVGHSAPRDQLRRDIWVWGVNHDGRFTIKSAYDLISTPGTTAPYIRWEKVWKWRGPQRIILFLWLALQDRLLTNVERGRRHLTADTNCARCGDRAKTVSHVLRNCQVAYETWIARHASSWSRSIVKGSNRDRRCLGSTAMKKWDEISWDPGPTAGVTINTDGSYIPTVNKASTGGIIRSHEGRVLVDFTMNLGACSITRAEIRGAITGLELAWDYGFQIVELHLDSRAPISILTSPEQPVHQQALEALYFRELCQRDWRVTIKHVYREANKAADFLASHGSQFPFGIHLFPLSDCNLGHILRYDCLGISEPRLISIKD
ncbi:Putative ribonuclease H protein At1g65750 [Linum perenne]